MKTINERWKEIESRILPEDASKIQRMEAKRMFFLGYAICLDVITYEVVEISTEDGIKALESMRRQLLGFNEAIQLGAA